MPELPEIARQVGVSQVELAGFSGQEFWGRWTVGKQASVRFTLNAPQTLRLEVAGYLGQANQTLDVALDRTLLGHFVYKNLGGDVQFGRVAALPLSRGTHTLNISTNLSSRSVQPVVFAPKDPRDLGVAVQRLHLSVQPQTAPPAALPLDLLRSSAVTRDGYYLLPPQGPYLVAAPSGFSALFRTSGPAVLHYDFVRSYQGQQYRFTLNGQPFFQTRASAYARVVRGEVALPAGPGDQQRGDRQLGVQPMNVGGVRPTGFLLLHNAVPSAGVGLYINRLSLDPPGSPYPPLIAGLLTAALLALLVRFLLPRRQT